MRGGGAAGDGERGSGVVGENARAVEGGVGNGGSGVIDRAGRHRNEDGGRGGQPRGVGGGVGKGIGSRVAASRGVGVDATGCDRDGAVSGCRVAGDGQAGADVVGQHTCAIEHGVRRGRASVVDGQRVDAQDDGGRRGLAGCVNGGVGEGIETRIPGERRVGVRAVGGDRHRSMRRRRVGGDRQTGSGIVGQDRGTVEHDTSCGRPTVVQCQRRDGQRHGGRRGLTGGVGRGIGEGVGTGVVRRRRIGVGAVSRHADRAVGRAGVAGHREARALVVGEHGGADEGGVGRHGAGIVERLGRYRNGHAGG